MDGIMDNGIKFCIYVKIRVGCEHELSAVDVFGVVLFVNHLMKMISFNLVLLVSFIVLYDCYKNRVVHRHGYHHQLYVAPRYVFVYSLLLQSSPSSSSLDRHHHHQMI